MGIFLQYLIAAHAHHLQSIFNQITRRLFVGGQLKVLDNEVKNMFDPVERVVDCVGILKNGLDLARVLQLLARAHCQDVLTSVDNLSGGRADKAQNEIGQSGFATPALAGNRRNRRRLFGNHQIEVLQCDELLAGPQKATSVNFCGVADFQKGLGHQRLSHSRISIGDKRRNGLAAAPAAVAPLPDIYPSQMDSEVERYNRAAGDAGRVSSPRSPRAACAPSLMESKPGAVGCRDAEGPRKYL